MECDFCNIFVISKNKDAKFNSYLSHVFNHTTISIKNNSFDLTQLSTCLQNFHLRTKRSVFELLAIRLSFFFVAKGPAAEATDAP
jgi:hypothetical protein